MEEACAATPRARCFCLVPAETTAEKVFLRPQSQGPFTHEEELVRRDFEETFDALAAYAGTGRDTAYLVIAEFARSVAARFK